MATSEGSIRVPGNWLSLAQIALEKGPQGLGSFLDDPNNGITKPIQAQNYAQLLELACRIPTNTAELVDVILNHVREDKNRFETTTPDPLQKPLSTANLRKERGLQSGTNRISYYDIFKQSIIRWQTQRPADQQDVECSDATKWIWDRAGDQLLVGGAIYLCARYGLHELLQVLVNDERLRSRDDRVQVIFLGSPDTPYTPLGAAVRYQHLLCVEAIMTVDGATQHTSTNLDVLEDDNSRTPFLQSVLNIARQNLAMQQAQPATILENLKLMLEFLIRNDEKILKTIDLNGNTPYQHAMKIPVGDNLGGDDIVKYLRGKIFEEFSNPDLVRGALYGTTGKCREIGMELSDFNYSTHHFEIFVQDLERAYEEASNLLRFEDTLLYLHLPQLPQYPHLPHAPAATLLLRFLTWLRKMQVTTIIELRLPDCWAHHDLEFVVAEILSRFKVYEFDWVRIDADIGGLALMCQHREDIQQLRKLNIYQEQIPGQVLRFLTGPPSLEWLRKINHISVSAVCISPVERDEGLNQMKFDPPLSSYSEYSHSQLQSGGVLSLTRFRSEPRTFTVGEDASGLAMVKDITTCHGFLRALRQLQQRQSSAQLRVTMKKTQRCVQIMERGRVKIAIIDNGIDMSQHRLVENIVGGESFVKYGGDTGSSYLPWYAAAAPHGTQMAFLARSMNPWCQLYALRVGSLQADIDAKAAAQAVKWAITQQVDIISMSWVIDEENEDLTKAIELAAITHKILIFCATADVGSHPNPRFSPDSWKDYVITVSAASKYDTPLERSSHNVNVMLCGEKVQTSGPNYIRDIPNEISGSSAATALAAGIASLCLFLARMVNSDENAARFRERTVMLAVLSEMLPERSSPGLHILKPQRFFGTGFELPRNFDDGNMLPPVAGLSKLKWSTVSQDLQTKAWKLR